MLQPSWPSFRTNRSVLRASVRSRRLRNRGFQLYRAEVSMVLEARYGEPAQRELELFLATAAIVVVPLNVQHVKLAFEAFQRYDKGRHPAALILGDGCSDALAKVCSAPLLFKGHDFSRTDLVPAVPL